MPRKFSFFVVLAGAIAGGVWFQRNFEVHGLDQVTITRRGAAAATAEVQQTSTVPVTTSTNGAGGTIRVASFNIQVFGESKLAKPQVMPILAQVIRRFDVVAIQEVRATTQDVMPRFLQMINAEGASYDFVVGPRLGRTSSKEQYAFIFNRATIEMVPGSMYTVDDPDDRLHREPLVAGFTVRGPPPAQAFTFTLIDIHTDPDEVASEMNALDDVYRAVRDDGRHEDDIILLGDLNTDDGHLGELGQMPYLIAAISKQPSNTRGNKLYDNIIFDRRATTEYTGRSGVLNLMREYQLSLQDALEVSDHFPVWAEFSVYEGGQRGSAVASAPGEERSR
ncbi:MAG TPA: endonuclease/exonuclease/phosphatase family protein [Pirellulales bacterium]|nr:endonuclease/exonuclease/phosphatase family protein [Pirellulales bacterium]